MESNDLQDPVDIAQIAVVNVLLEESCRQAVVVVLILVFDWKQEWALPPLSYFQNSTKSSKGTSKNSTTNWL